MSFWSSTEWNFWIVFVVTLENSANSGHILYRESQKTWGMSISLLHICALVNKLEIGLSKIQEAITLIFHIFRLIEWPRSFFLKCRVQVLKSSSNSHVFWDSLDNKDNYNMGVIHLCTSKWSVGGLYLSPQLKKLKVCIRRYSRSQILLF